MSSMPRVITVDPTGAVGRLIRSAVDLMSKPVILTDVPTGAEALEEIQRGDCNLVVTAWELQRDVGGLELALRVNQTSESTQTLVLGDVDDPDTLDEETTANSPFTYLSRPVQVNMLLRVISAGLDGQDIKQALEAPDSTGGSVLVDLGPVPPLDINTAAGFMDSLMRDLGPMAILLVNREGEVLVEAGAVGYVDRERMAQTLLPAFMTNIKVKDVLGGQSNAMLFFDGDEHDVFLLSVGLHYFMCIVFDGESGGRALGPVRTYGRRAASDLAAMLGPMAWVIQEPRKEIKERALEEKRKTEEHLIPGELLARGSFGTEEEEEEALEPVFEAPTFEEEPILEALSEDDFDDLLGMLEGGIEGEEVDEDIFALDNLEDMAKEAFGGKKIDFDSAVDLGLIDD